LTNYKATSVSFYRENVAYADFWDIDSLNYIEEEKYKLLIDWYYSDILETDVESMTEEMF